MMEMVKRSTGPAGFTFSVKSACPTISQESSLILPIHLGNNGTVLCIVPQDRATILFVDPTQEVLQPVIVAVIKELLPRVFVPAQAETAARDSEAADGSQQADDGPADIAVVPAISLKSPIQPGKTVTYSRSPQRMLSVLLALAITGRLPPTFPRDKECNRIIPPLKTAVKALLQQNPPMNAILIQLAHSMETLAQAWKLTTPASVPETPPTQTASGTSASRPSRLALQRQPTN